MKDLKVKRPIPSNYSLGILLLEFQLMDFTSEHTCLHGPGILETGLQSPVKESRGPSLLPNSQENFSDEGQLEKAFWLACI